MKLRTCVSPAGRFVYGLHRPHFIADNFRETDGLAGLGAFADGSRHRNTANFPSGPVNEPAADWIFEIPNAFPFRGATYIGKAWADARAGATGTIKLPEAPALSFSQDHPDEQAAVQAIRKLARPLQLALAVTSTDARDLCCLAHVACTMIEDETGGPPRGLAYRQQADGRVRAVIADEALFDAVANNRHLPDAYKQAMALRPGVQGDSEIVGEWRRSAPHSHVFEYLRRNSYIPWGHYAANMADDAVRYGVDDLSLADMAGMRHLYYQRSYTRLAGLLDLPPVAGGRTLTDRELETLRRRVLKELKTRTAVEFTRTLWGWNFGFDYAPSGYRLHASHQQIHQQFALVPAEIPLATDEGVLPAYACGDLVGDFVNAFRMETGKGFFDCYEKAIRGNRRMDDGARGEHSLVVHEDDRVMVFVPKAQTSQWELQLMPKATVGNIVEADAPTRRSLDRAILVAVKVLGAMGARMITTIEYSKPFVGGHGDQRMLLSFLPRLPESPGAFSEAQLRWINGHYPEDFARACRAHLPQRMSERWKKDR
ncbi:hypothetical protein DSCA_31670 [Desulfosarcina alkanivorans]|uniref:Uncharacterized protein n=1 Tax=Desulfosarcina alkanivorans TaxID=571177 RepID=A0A5K7YX20_9BACT|nr:hypothetical protein [Desulfosarcina alkanivorans]BBO69237.1 hypothetical protein DSCA_31670 [Desulfosarcina alkanivorans]